MTSNRPLEDWGKPAPGRAHRRRHLDRFLHHAQVIAITGKSYRLKDTSLGKPKLAEPNADT